MCGCLSCTHTRDLASNPGTCPDWEWNWWPFGSQAGTQSTEPHHPGLMLPSSDDTHFSIWKKKNHPWNIKNHGLKDPLGEFKRGNMLNTVFGSLLRRNANFMLPSITRPLLSVFTISSLSALIPYSTWIQPQSESLHSAARMFFRHSLIMTVFCFKHLKTTQNKHRFLVIA